MDFSIPAPPFSARQEGGRCISALCANGKNESDSSRLSGNPRAWVLESLVYANLRLTDRDFAQVVLQGQKSVSVVLTSDLFTIGGYGNVCGYEPAPCTGDSGAAVNIDLYRQFDTPDRWYAQAGPFVDYGIVHNRVQGSTLENNLWSAGLDPNCKRWCIRLRYN